MKHSDRFNFLLHFNVVSSSRKRKKGWPIIVMILSIIEWWREMERVDDISLSLTNTRMLFSASGMPQISNSKRTASAVMIILSLFFLLSLSLIFSFSPSFSLSLSLCPFLSISITFLSFRKKRNTKCQPQKSLSEISVILKCFCLKFLNTKNFCLKKLSKILFGWIKIQAIIFQKIK